MKALLVTEFFPSGSKLNFTGGVEARTFFIARHLALQDKVKVVCRRTQKLSCFKKIANISVYPCGFKTQSIAVSFMSVFSRLVFMISAFFKGLKLDFDVIEGSNFVSFLPAFFLGLIKKKPVVFWYPDLLGNSWFKYFGFTGLFGWLMEKLSLVLQPQQIISLSKQTKKKLIQAGVSQSKIQVVYGGVDLKKFKITQKELVAKKKNIICIARLVKYKRVEDLVLAFSQLVKQYPDFNLTIIGQGPEEKRLKSLTKKLKINSQVHFAKNLSQKELIEFLKQSYVLCLPSLVEGFGLVTIEAAALGTPYLIANTAISQEVSRKGRGGLLFQPADFNDLASKLDKLLNSKKLYQLKQKQALRLAKNYSWDKIAIATRKAYLKVLKGKQ